MEPSSSWLHRLNRLDGYDASTRLEAPITADSRAVCSPCEGMNVTPEAVVDTIKPRASSYAQASRKCIDDASGRRLLEESQPIKSSNRSTCLEQRQETSYAKSAASHRPVLKLISGGTAG
ncbi:unnamed protein product [Protopolystoma xenopodis]|uniref:Uncharacterized protein n=1 Tax=Protopolystoma xenopodis TaxID=117903 RepID=A0A448XPH1_9PLAT|nr:unnamed protein product [Protopolystoma xenopodis]